MVSMSVESGIDRRSIPRRCPAVRREAGRRGNVATHARQGSSWRAPLVGGGGSERGRAPPPVARTGIGFVCLDEAAQQLEEDLGFLTLERRDDALLRGDDVGAQAITQRLAARGEPERPRSAVGWANPPFDIAHGSQAIDEMMGAHRVYADARSKGSLLDAWHVLERGDNGPFDR